MRSVLLGAASAGFVSVIVPFGWRYIAAVVLFMLVVGLVGGAPLPGERTRP